MRKVSFGIQTKNFLIYKKQSISKTNLGINNSFNPKYKKQHFRAIKVFSSLILNQNKRTNCTKLFSEKINSFSLVSIQNKKEEKKIFLNFSFDKGRLKNIVLWFLKNYGQHKTIFLLEHLKDIGFGYATKAGISLGIDDLKIPPQKISLLQSAQNKILEGQIQYKRGEITGVERFQRLIDTWHQTSENLKQEVIRHFEATDVLNPVYMMAFSGARGNISQVRQLVGMRGLMADPQGRILDFPIRSNFREGLTLTEYVISTYGARKGIVDTALRTANAGYLTRRLVDVAQHVIVAELDCGTKKGIFVFDMKEGNKTIYSLSNRLIGRVLARDIIHNNETIGYRNQEVSSDLAQSISTIAKKALIRSPLTCETKKLVCQLCYGWSLSNSTLVSIGESVGIIAAQSIGEPGTQLTMRTFHTGGVFSGGISDQIIAQYDGIVEYSHAIPGLCIRTPQGQIAFLTKMEGSLVLKELEHSKTETSTSQGIKESFNSKAQIFNIPSYTLLFKRNQEKVFKKQIIGQLSSLSTLKTQRGDDEQTIYSEFEGQIYNSHIDVIGKINESNDITFEAWGWGYLWILAGKIYQCPIQSFMFPYPSDFVNKNTVLNRINWVSPQKCLLQIETVNNNNMSLLKAKTPRPVFFQKNLKHSSNISFNEKVQQSQTFSNRNSNFLHSQSSSFIHFKTKKKKSFKKTSFNFAKYLKNSNLLLNKNKQFSLSKNINSVSSSLLPLEIKKSEKNNLIFLDLKRQQNLLKKRDTFSQFQLEKNFIENYNFGLKKIAFLNLSTKICSNRLIKIKFNPEKLNKFNFKLYLVQSLTSLDKKVYSNYPFQPLIKTLIKESFNQKTFGLPELYPTNNRMYIKQKKQFFLLSQVFNLNKWTLMNLVHQTVKNKIIKSNINSGLIANTNKSSFILSKAKNYFKNRKDCKQIFSVKNSFWTLNTFKKEFSLFQKLNLRKTKYSLLPIKKQLKRQYLVKSIRNNPNSNLQIKQTTNYLKFIKPKYIVNKNQHFVPILKQKMHYFKSCNFNSIIYTNNVFNMQKISNLKEQKKIQTSNIFLQKPVLFFNLNNISYNKFGYNFSIKSKFDNDQFFILNSLKTQLIKHQKQNTYQWSPISTLLLKWSITDYQTNTNGIFSFNSIFPKTIVLSKTKKNESLLEILNFFFKENNHFFLDYYQSAVKNYLTSKKKGLFKYKSKRYYQILKKKNLYPIIIDRKTNKITNSIKKISITNILNFSSCQKINLKLKQQQNFKNLNLSNSYYLTHSVTPSLAKNSFFIKKHCPLLIIEQQKEFYVSKMLFNKANKKSFFSTKLKLKGFMDVIETKKQSNFQIESYPLFKFRWKNVDFINKTAKSSKKNRRLRSKTSQKISRLQKIKSQFSVTSKLSVPFRELFWIPQEDYKINKYNDNKQFKFLSSDNLSYPPNLSFTSNKLNTNIKKIDLQSKLPLFYMNNRQGIKKAFYPNLKGVIQIFNTKKKTNIRLIKQKNSYKSKTKKFADKLLENNFLNFQIKFWEFLNKKWQHSYTFKTGLFHNTLNVVKEKKQLASTNKFFQEKSDRPYYSQIHLNKQFFNVSTLIPVVKQDCSTLFMSQRKKSKNNEKELIETEITHIRVQQGWLYYTKKDVSKFHETILNPGNVILDDVVFEKNKTYLSCHVLNKPSSNFAKFKTEVFSRRQNENGISSHFNVTSQLKSQKSRFMIKNSFSSNCSNSVCLFIQPVHYKLVPNLNLFKKQMFKVNKQFNQLHFSKLLLNKFYSSSLNKLFYDKKLVPSLPNVDLDIFTNFEIKKSPKFYKPLVQKKQKHKRKFLYSAYSLNMLPLNISSVIPTAFSYGFKQSSVHFNSLNITTFRTLDNIQNLFFSDYLFFLNKVFNKLILKQQIKQFQKETPLEKNIKIFSMAPENINNSIRMQKSDKSNYWKLIASLGSFISLPCLNFSVENNMAYLINQKLFATDFTNQGFDYSSVQISQNLGICSYEDFLKEKVFQERQSFYSDCFSSFPISKNEIIVSSSNVIRPNQAFANTSFLSPIEGEVLVNSTNSWSFKSDNNRSLFLTVSDLFSFSLINETFKNSLTDPFQLLNSRNKNEKNKPFFPIKFEKVNKYPQYNFLISTLTSFHQNFLKTEEILEEKFHKKSPSPVTTLVQYNDKILKIKGLNIGSVKPYRPLRLGSFLVYGDLITLETGTDHAGQIIHISSKKVTLRYAQPISASPKGVLHAYNGDFIAKNSPVITLPFQTLKTGDIVQGIPKVEQYFEARTTKRGRLFRDSLPNLLQGIFERYRSFLPLETAVQQSLLKIQQIIVDGVQRVYRSQGVSIADKHLEVIIRQMTRKVLIVNGGQTGFFAGELVDLELIEKVNPFLLCKINYEPVILGITRASLEVDSFLSAASFQQTTKILSRAAIYKKKDFLKGLKENIIVGNLIPSGTGYLVYLQDIEIQSKSK